ncbi:uncharacterized protein LOC130803672 [Amaranthus tricolor]|uniref:uncharacterized protein LOC130803672 n=1 Tax=Amaranthus tricolor TaxID=29722 RepID=UPI00258AF59A|nr:uncharacterized protein LOC130803672 [Amaranthus tricolor]
MAQMEHVLRLFQQMNKTNKPEPEPEPEHSTPDLKVSEKLTYHNYTKWCKLMHIALDSRGRLKHIIAAPPAPADPNYNTAWDLWKGIETLLGSGRDELQIFDLSTRANAIKQNNDTIEVYFSKLNTIWKEIDRRQPNPMKSDEDITIFNKFIQTQRLYQFLAGLDESLDKERRDLINQVPLPTLDMAYAAVRREISRRGIMVHTSSLGHNPSEIGCDLIAHHRSRHTKDTCFKLVGYPDWWEDLQKKKAATKAPVHRAGGKALLSTAEVTGEEDPNHGGLYREEIMEDAHEKTHEKGTRNEEEERDPRFRERKEKPAISEGGSENFPFLDAQTGTVIGHGTERGGLYYVDETTPKGQALLARGSSDQLFWLWHRRLGHPSLAYLNFLFPSVKNNMLTLDCETCVLAKSCRHSYLPSVSRTGTPFSLIHSDVWGPAPVFATSTDSYYVLFVDDCTRMSWVYFLKHKSEVFSVFVTFYNMLHTQFQATPKIIRSDNGGEFVNSSMKHFFSDRGMIHQTSCPYTPQQNGVAERKNRTLLDITRAILLESNTPASF